MVTNSQTPGFYLIQLSQRPPTSFQVPPPEPMQPSPTSSSLGPTCSPAAKLPDAVCQPRSQRLSQLSRRATAAT